LIHQLENLQDQQYTKLHQSTKENDSSKLPSNIAYSIQLLEDLKIIRRLSEKQSTEKTTLLIPVVLYAIERSLQTPGEIPRQQLIHCKSGEDRAGRVDNTIKAYLASVSELQLRASKDLFRFTKNGKIHTEHLTLLTKHYASLHEFGACPL